MNKAIKTIYFDSIKVFASCNQAEESNTALKNEFKHNDIKSFIIFKVQ